MCKLFGSIIVSAVIALISIFLYNVDFTPIKDQYLMPVDEAINYYGYKGEKHLIVTQDEFELTLHRIVPKVPNNESNSVVIFIHGIHSSSRTFVKMGPGKEYVFNISDAGYDIWLVNLRGNSYARPIKNKVKHSYDDLYYFSMHEQAINDMPAIVDYIGNATGKSRFKFLANSLSTATMMVFLATLPKYNQNVDRIIQLAPIGPYINIEEKLAKAVTAGLEKRYFWDWVGDSDVTMRGVISRVLCTNKLFGDLCHSIVNATGGLHGELHMDLKRSFFLTVFTTLTLGIYHHGFQVVEKGRWSMRDYGEEENLKRYNTSTPPDYNMDNVKAPSILIYAEDDVYLRNGRIEWMFKLIPNVIDSYKMPSPFQHCNFVIGDGYSVNPELLRILMQSIKKEY